MLNEISQPDRERQILHGIIYMWNLKNQKSQAHKKQRVSRMVVPKGWAVGEMRDIGQKVQTFNYNMNTF